MDLLGIDKIYGARFIFTMCKENTTVLAEI